MKGIAIWTAFLIVTVISLAGLIIVLKVVYPTYQRVKESVSISEGMRNLKLIRSQISYLVREGGGSRKFPISIGSGEYVVDRNRGVIEFLIRSENGIIAPGSFFEQDKLKIISGSRAKAYGNSTHLILENDLVRVTFKNLSTSFFGIIDEIFLKEKNMVIKLANSSVVFNLNPSFSVTPVNSFLARSGDKLAKAEAIFNSSKFRVIFTLPSNSDYLIVRSIGSESFTLELLFKLGTSANDDIIYVPEIGSNTTNNFNSGCWDRTNILHYYICSNDNETTPMAMLALIHLGEKILFGKVCFSNTSVSNYTLNLTSSKKIALALSVENCTGLNRAVESDEEQRIQSSIAELPPSQERSYEVIITSEYDTVDIRNNARLRPGVKNVCLSYVGLVDNRPSIEVLPC
jgi:hypothetical protein